MEKAYVLLNVDIGSRKEVLDYLKAIPDVKGVHQLYGVYDFIIHVEAETMQELKEFINKIKCIDKIRSTLSLICV